MMDIWTVGVGLFVVGAGALALSRRSASASSGAGGTIPKVSTKIVVVDGRRVLVHVPPNLKRLRTVIYLHGNGTSIDTVKTSLLPEFDKANDPAIIVAPQLGPVSEPGNLADVGGFARLLKGVDAPLGQVDLLAHSGGYKAAAAALTRGGVVISSVGLLDALYGELPAFQGFALAPGSRHFANVYGPSTSKQGFTLGGDLAKVIAVGRNDVATAIPDVAFMRKYKATMMATNVFHPSVPAVYGAAMIDAFS